MKYKFIKIQGSTVYVEINKEIVMFTQEELTDPVDEYSNMYLMYGYIEDVFGFGNAEGVIEYTAIGSYEKGSDNFIELTDIEKYN